jgi:hypothetical protein
MSATDIRFRPNQNSTAELSSTAGLPEGDVLKMRRLFSRWDCPRFPTVHRIAEQIETLGRGSVSSDV